MASSEPTDGAAANVDESDGRPSRAADLATNELEDGKAREDANDADGVDGVDGTIVIEPLDAASFAPFGEVIELGAEPSTMINRGLCGRHHDLATLDFVDGGTAGVSLFDGTPYALPHTLDLVERHPLGSQAFLPMSTVPFLVICCEDEGGVPVRPRAWLTDGRQGVNYARGTWHGVLTPLARPALFAVVDRIGGTGDNLEEHAFAEPFRIVDRHGLVPADLDR